jgi:AcrR family transcriptional regulator
MQAAKGKGQTKSRIVSAAWRLFYEKGYDNTTVDEIIAESGTSKGSFYHYFEGKDALLSSLSFLFDEKYEELMQTIDPDLNSFDKLLYLNREVFSMIEDTVPLDLLARMYSTQLITRGDKHLLDHNRVYYRLLRKITAEGQSRGQIRSDITVNEFTKAYALCERALLYDWCICNGDYSLSSYSAKMLPMFLSQFRIS